RDSNFRYGCVECLRMSGPRTAMACSPTDVAADRNVRALRRRDLESWCGLAATGLAAVWLVLITLNAGPLWRDEVNSINIARMPSFHEFWSNLTFESFPPLWLLLLRVWNLLGLAGSDAGI